MSTQTTDVAAWLDELEEARKAIKAIDLARSPSAFITEHNVVGRLVAVVRGVLALAEEAERDAAEVWLYPGETHPIPHRDR